MSNKVINLKSEHVTLLTKLIERSMTFPNHNNTEDLISYAEILKKLRGRGDSGNGSGSATGLVRSGAVSSVKHEESGRKRIRTRKSVPKGSPDVQGVSYDTVL